VTQELQSFWQDEAGSELVEWAVVTSILLLATVGVLTLIGDELKAAFERILAELQGSP
jgi:Flp pilus assembly pilin Flp